MKHYLLLWATQAVSALGSAMTAYALVIWSYTQEGSALKTALLMVASYAPYVLFSVFAGAISDRWNKKYTMLACDALAAVSTLVVLYLLKTEQLAIWHLYLVNAVSGLMNTVQQPASEVMTTALLPRKYYQKVGSLRYLASSATSILTPILATAILGLGGIETVIAIDLASFLIAAFALLFFIPLPAQTDTKEQKESFFQSVQTGLRFLHKNLGIFHLMLFLAAINLVASMYNAALPAMLLPKPGAGETAMGIVNTVVGVASLAGSIIATGIKAPKSRVKAIWICLMISMSTENFFLAFGKTTLVWSIGAFLGWVLIPFMSTNLEAVYRLSIPQEIQGRVFAARNSFQFFTIPLGYLLGGALVDHIFEPLMASQTANSLLVTLFGAGKGSGAACFFAVIGVLGMLVCLLFRSDKHILAIKETG